MIGKTISYNVRGIHEVKKRGVIKGCLKRWKPDVVRLQETKSEEINKKVINSLGSYVFASKLKTLKNEIKRWARVEEGRLETILKDNLTELEDCDRREMGGILGENGRVRREHLRKEIAEVMHLEAISRRQKVREKWLKEGDRNTWYFHCMANSHQNNNYVEELWCNGEVVSGNENMRKMTSLFFQQLYKEEEQRRPNLDNLHFEILCDESRDGLAEPFTEEEIRGCLDECNGDKALGPDVLSLLLTLSIQPSWFIFLRWLSAKDIKDFRPIRLVGSIYKLISKVLAKKLSKVLGEVIGENQNAFVEDRQILDAINQYLGLYARSGVLPSKLYQGKDLEVGC
ncbi:uncharacterized protein LOC110815570 [Carica papaya]|uniref:uncharacterized protein LOC110815570 n=1 Tax=Carica papaya TaxID=3649 RepID=UPI000B8CD379|nr:uncharacterized protein LOC110815570 [Carica papaya]